MSSFDHKIADTFLVAVRAGASNEVAAQHAEVDLDIVRDWMRENDEFRKEVEKSRAALELLAVGTVRRNMNDDRQAAMWLAERTRGDSELERLRNLTT